VDLVAARQGFRKGIEAEIMRRIEACSDLRMSKSEIEDIGVAAGMIQEDIASEFRSLAGDVWCGLVYPEDKSEPYYVDGPIRRLPSWVAVNFELGWFHRKGKIHTSP
jgi:hypothetical protein